MKKAVSKKKEENISSLYRDCALLLHEMGKIVYVMGDFFVALLEYCGRGQIKRRSWQFMMPMRGSRNDNVWLSTFNREISFSARPIPVAQPHHVVHDALLWTWNYNVSDKKRRGTRTRKVNVRLGMEAGYIGTGGGGWLWSVYASSYAKCRAIKMKRFQSLLTMTTTTKRDIMLWLVAWL